MFSIKADLKDLTKQLEDIHKKHIPFAVSLSINRTAQKVKANEEREMRDVFDRPTPFTQNSVFIKPSTKATLTAIVSLKDSASKGTPAAKYLQAQISGGERRMKRFEVALRSVGVLPEGYFIVPGAAAKMDQYGNMDSRQIIQILSYFKSFGEAGYKANSTEKTRERLGKSTKSRYGMAYFVGRPNNGKLPLGIWQKVFSNFGVAIRPVMIFVRSANYEAIFDFKYVADTTISREFYNEFNKAWADAVRSAN